MINWATMEASGFQTLAKLGTALFGDAQRSTQISKETLSTVSLLKLDDDLTLERTFKILIDRAERERPKGSLHEPFYRLATQERFLITALQSAHWNYSRIASVLGVNDGQVEEWAWQIRLQLSQTGMDANQYPSGSRLYALDCPEYDSKRPWTQRFMDHEMGGQERLFLQHHLMTCQSCRNTLSRCRELIYRVEAAIPKFSSSKDSARELQKLWEKTQAVLNTDNRSVGLSFRRFIRHRDVRFILAALAALVIWIAIN